jgi:hypothetical protein
MKITLNLSNSCMVIFEADDGHSYGPNACFESINDAIAYAEEEISIRLQATRAFIIDSETGELLAECEDDATSDSDSDFDFDWNYDEDTEHDPLMGDFSNDF